MDLYSEIILDHYKHPHNKGPLDTSTHSANEDNPLCGDKLEMHLEIADGTVKKANFDGVGCAISQAAASMLTDHLVGKSEEEITKITDKDIVDLLNIPISPGRIKCATLALITTKKCLQ